MHQSSSNALHYANVLVHSGCIANLVVLFQLSMLSRKCCHFPW